MKRWWPAVLLAGLWATVLSIALTPEVDGGHGAPHALFQEMDRGGSGQARHGPVSVAAWLFGSLMIALFASLLAWQARDASGEGHPMLRSGPAFWIGGLLYESVFSMMCWRYWKSVDDPAAAFWGPFPEAVSWLVFGIWLAPGAFILLYVQNYARWIWPEENKLRFDKLLADNRRN